MIKDLSEAQLQAMRNDGYMLDSYQGSSLRVPRKGERYMVADGKTQYIFVADDDHYDDGQAYRNCWILRKIQPSTFDEVMMRKPSSAELDFITKAGYELDTRRAMGAADPGMHSVTAWRLPKANEEYLAGDGDVILKAAANWKETCDPKFFRWIVRKAPPAPSFVDELTALINKHSMENGSNTPDFILAQFLSGCLDAWNGATNRRESWYTEAD